MSQVTKRRLEISITAIFVAALLLVGAVLIFSGGSATAKQVATLRIFQGQVEVQSQGGAFEPGEEGGALQEGDTVRTGSDGRAAIEYFDGSVTRLDFDSVFKLVTLETLDNAAGSKVIEAEQTQGNSYNRVAELTDAESRFEVETPTATASVQGTVYAILFDPTRVLVIDGSVVVESDGNQIEVPAGKMVTINEDGTFGPLEDIPEELLNSDFLNWNLCDLDDEGDCVLGETVSPTTTPTITTSTTTAPTTTATTSPQTNSPPTGGPGPTDTTTPSDTTTVPTTTTTTSTSTSTTPPPPPPSTTSTTATSTATVTTTPPTTTTSEPPPTTTTSEPPPTTTTTTPAPTCPLYSLSLSVPSGHANAGSNFNAQVSLSNLEGADPNAQHTISLSGPFGAGETTETRTGAGQVVFNGLVINEPGTYTISASAACATGDSASITVDPPPGPGSATGSGGGSEAAIGLVLLLPALPALGVFRRKRR